MSSTAFRRSRSACARRSRPRSCRQSNAHEHGGRGELAGGIAEQVELAHEILVEDADLAVEDERAGRESRDRGGDVGKARRVVAAAAADQPDVAAVLDRGDAPTVVLLFVDPAVTVEWFRAARMDQLDR